METNGNKMYSFVSCVIRLAINSATRNWPVLPMQTTKCPTAVAAATRCCLQLGKIQHVLYVTVKIDSVILTDHVQARFGLSAFQSGLMVLGH